MELKVSYETQSKANAHPQAQAPAVPRLQFPSKKETLLRYIEAKSPCDSETKTSKLFDWHESFFKHLTEGKVSQRGKGRKKLEFFYNVTCHHENVLRFSICIWFRLAPVHTGHRLSPYERRRLSWQIDWILIAREHERLYRWCKANRPVHDVRTRQYCICKIHTILDFWSLFSFKTYKSSLELWRMYPRTKVDTQTHAKNKYFCNVKNVR